MTIKAPKIVCVSILLMSLYFCLLVVLSPKVLAFNASNLIDDSTFTNTKSTNATAIDNTFLNNFPNSCISSNNGFMTSDPQGWSTTSNSYTFGGSVTAGQAIYDAATHYSINPQVLLATMQKEQSLFTGSAGCYNLPSPTSTIESSSKCDIGTDTSSLCTQACIYNGGCINIGLGYGCPYYCYASSEGFSNQLINAAWAFRFAQQRAYGNLTGYSGLDPGDQDIYYSGPMTQGYRQRSATDSSNYYDGTYTTSDGTSITVTNGATASLYSYTPFVSGNKNFDSIFTQYFGGLFAAPYQTSLSSESSFPHLNPGQTTTVYLEYQNLGSYAWYDDASISTAPSGTNPVHLATSSPINRFSQFAGAGWANAARPAVNFTAVYDSDGVTLASNQNIALPGQIVKFSFSLTAPNNIAAGTYQENFMPIAEGTSNGAFNNPGTYLDVIVNPVPSIALNSQSSFPTILPSESQQVYFSFTNTGNTPLYDDNSIAGAPAGSYPVHLATDCPINSSSDFSNGWPSADRPAVNFTAVYDSDGVTLASNQNIALPGQIVKFSFSLTIPSDYTAGTYKACFQPILEGTNTGYFPDLGLYLNVTVPTSSVLYLSGYPAAMSMTGGETNTFSMNIQNLGNTALPSNSTITTSDGTKFQDESWPNQNTALNLSQSIAPLSSLSSGPITLLAPIAAQVNVPTHFTVTQPNSSNTLSSSESAAINLTVYQPVFNASFVSQSAFPTLTYYQNQTAYISYKNNGNIPWRDDTGMVGQDTRNLTPVHLATANPLNRAGGFSASGWPSADRPAVNFTAVYDSDGVTLASNQNIALPGQIVKFSFSLSAQNWVNPGTYREYFQPVAEGTSNGGFNSTGTYLDITIPSLTYQSKFFTESSFPSLTPGQSTTSFFEYQNTGTAPWLDDTAYGLSSQPVGLYPVHLATSSPINRFSQFAGAGWANAARPAVNFTAVYDSDGVTLASNQNIALPGQIVKFSFSLTAPNNIAAGTYQENFMPIAEGTSNGAFNNPGTYLDVTIQ